MSKPEAIIDTLFIGERLQSKIGDFSLSEIQFFSYLGCLLSLYDGQTATKWNYSFIKSSLGSPYSADILNGIEILLSNESIIETDRDYYKITEKGKSNLNFYVTLELLNWRCKYLNIACHSLSVFPYGVIKEAIINDPVVVSARSSPINKLLLDDSNPATGVLYTQFALLKIALSDQYESLMAPALVWIESLRKKNTQL
ncbi:hypothetical protein GCM10023091_16400 [Ravibacter arvi]|uniref:Transcriptional regulator n=1 Tax=Ravibacter arvi TaxID=2051041 RepID=A0ABP8LXK8_9BACT